MASSKRLETVNAGESGEKEPSYTVGGNVNRYNHYLKQYGGSFKKLKLDWLYDLAIVLFGIYPKKIVIPKKKKHMHPNVHYSTIYNDQDIKAN